MNIPPINLGAILPVIVLSVFGTAVMAAEPFVRRNRSRLGMFSLAGVGAAALSVFVMSGSRGQWYSNLWIVDDYNIFFHVIFLFIAAMTILASMDFLEREQIHHGEYYALLLFATAGMLMMSGSNELIMMFLGLEILSIATYVLAGFRRSDLRSNESALKYFLLGSFSSAFFLYGIALAFGATGSTNLLAIADALRNPNNAGANLASLAAALMLIALCFKVAVAPFHVWTPDVYEGAPTPVTGFMSVGPKAAGFAVLFRVFLTAFPSIQDRWSQVIWLVAALTMVLGNVIALVQPNIKRMLAYSSIAHAGYIAVAFVTGTDRGVSAALFYALAYSVMNLGAFTIVTVLSRSEDKLVHLSDYAGLASRRPGLAALLSVFLLSLAGVPLTAGFAGKFLIFRSAVEQNFIWLAVIGVVSTVVSFYYYLYVIVQMYMREPTENFDDVRITPAVNFALLITLAGTLYLGILPRRILEWTAQAVLR